MAKLSPQEVEDRASEARALMNNRVLNEALDSLHAEYMNQLIQAEVGSLTAATAHASIRVTAGVREQLQVYINEAIMQRKK